MGKWKTVAGVLLIFVLGALIGSLGTSWMLKYRHPLFRKDPAGRVPFIMRRLSDRLDLNDSQKVEIEAVLRRIDDQMRQHFNQQRVEMRRFIEAETEAIKPLLTPRQQEEYQRFREAMEARHRKGGEPPPPPPPE